MLLEVQNLKTYLSSHGKIIKAVDDISFTLAKGKTFCLVGESGSGKSITALSIMQLLPSGISSHPGGSIHFDYRQANHQTQQVDLLNLKPDQQQQIRGSRIAMIFQEPMTSLNPVFSIGEQIIEALQLHQPQLSYAAARQKTLEALQQVQIPRPEQRIDDYPHRLSGGQRQRVMIAMAIACEPDLLIADEPTTALDVTVQKEILQLMRDLQIKNDMAILFITHDFGVVANIADQLAVMRQGKIVESGPLKQVLANPQHDYTQKLLAALPENLPVRKAHDTSMASETPALIDIRQLQVYFPIRQGLFQHTVDTIKAVDNVDLKIAKGQILALVGESGCGKTTLGRAILRLIEPTHGEVYFDGQALTGLDQAAMRRYRQQLQIVFQDPMSSLNPRLKIATTLTEPMAVHGIGSCDEERLQLAQQTLMQVQLEPDHLWRYPHEFSGGQRQRIGIARALVLNPQFIVCDEITSALDVSVQAEILAILLELRQMRHLTLLFITHNISVVEYLSDEIAVMHQGRIVEKGSTRQVCNNPQQAYTQELLSAVPRISLQT